MIFGNWSMDTGRRPLCGCFVLSCMVGGIFRKPLGFRRCLPPARPEKAKPFQAGRSPCTKHPQDCPASPLRTEKSFRGFRRGVFSKRSLAGCGTASHKERESLCDRARLFRRDEVPARNTHKIVRLRLQKPKKVFEGSKGRFFKNAPLAGCGTASHKRGKACTTGHAFSGGTNTSIRKRGCKKILSEFFDIPFSMSSIYFFFFFLTAK